jgi:hypothetical protein
MRRFITILSQFILLIGLSHSIKAQVSLPPVEPSKELQHYTMFYTARSQRILGSEDSRTGGGFSLAVGRRDPKLRMGNLNGELVWEGYLMQTNSLGVNGDPPNTIFAFGVLASSRYRWQFRNDVNIFADVGFGVQWVDHSSTDLPLAFNTSPTIALGLEFKSGTGAFQVGTRLFHVSNGGRQNPNPGQNYLQFFVGIKY